MEIKILVAENRELDLDNFIKTCETKASFLSAISAQNYHWLVNPRGETKPISFEEDDMMVQLWKEAESKTFNPEKTLIFEIL